MQVGLFGKSGWICFPVSGSVMESGLYNEHASKKGCLRRLVVNPFPENGIMAVSHREDC